MSRTFLLLGCLIASVCSQSCYISSVYNSPGQYTNEEQSHAEFCKESLVGSILTTKTILVIVLQAKVSCESGERVQMFTSERELVYDYCNQRTLKYITAKNKYLIMRLISPSSSHISVTFNLYLIEPTPSAIENSTSTTTTPSVILSSITTTLTTTTVTTTTATHASVLACGIQAIKPNEQLLRIVGGSEAVPNSWPWQAYLVGDTTCGASLIDNEWLATAAHCVYGSQAESVQVCFNLHILSVYKPTTVCRILKKIVIHSNYNPPNKEHDIALLKIEFINFTNTTSPICLTKQDDNLAQPGKAGTVIGWGKIEGYGATSDKLKQVTMNVTTCFFSPSENFICSGQKAPNTVLDACRGDSGGAFMIKSGNRYFLSGIVSWGSHTCHGESAYVKVSNYIDWIDTIRRTN